MFMIERVMSIVYGRKLNIVMIESLMFMMESLKFIKEGCIYLTLDLLRRV